MERKEYAIGEIFEHDGKHYVVKENKDCDCTKCAFADGKIGCDNFILCSDTERKDREDVRFEELESVCLASRNSSEFNLQRAIAGEKVQTVRGRPVRIVCTDLKDSVKKILALVDYGSYERICSYTEDGKQCVGANAPDDLMMCHEKKEKWVVVLKDENGVPYFDIVAYETLKEAREYVKSSHNEKYCVTIQKIEYYE